MTVPTAVKPAKQSLSVFRRQTNAAVLHRDDCLKAFCLQSQDNFPASRSDEVGLTARLIYHPRQWLTASLNYEFENYDSTAVYYEELKVPSAGVVLKGVSRPYLIDYANHRITLQVALGF